jgi:hypothetical protein
MAAKELGIKEMPVALVRKDYTKLPKYESAKEFYPLMETKRTRKLLRKVYADKQIGRYNEIPEVAKGW